MVDMGLTWRHMTHSSVSWQVPVPQGFSAQDLAGAAVPRGECPGTAKPSAQ